MPDNRDRSLPVGRVITPRRLDRRHPAAALAGGIIRACALEARLAGLTGFERLAVAPPGTLETYHGIVGTMWVSDWHRWAFKHADHHLRRFGL